MTTYGQRFIVRSDDKPIWLPASDRIRAYSPNGEYLGTRLAQQHVWRFAGNDIALSADHWAYEPIKAGFTPWAGGHRGPVDWVGDIILRGGLRMACRPGLNWSHNQYGNGQCKHDIIGYHSTAGDPVLLDDTPPKWTGGIWHDDNSPAQAVSDLTYQQAARLLRTLSDKHFPDDPVTPLEMLSGVLGQIDHITSGLTRMTGPEWAPGYRRMLHIPTVQACIDRLMRDNLNDDLMYTVDLLKELLPPPAPTEAEKLYRTYAEQTTMGAPGTEADMVAFADWIISQQSVAP